MSVVKTLALGVSILGSMVAPTLAGSMRASHQIPDRPRLSGLPEMPTSLLVSRPIGGSVASAENLANVGWVQQPQSFQSYSVPASFPNQASPLSLGYTNPGISFAPQPVAVAPVAPSYPAPAATIIAPAPPAASISASSSHTTAAFINFGNGPYSEAQTLTTGNPQAWYQSASVQSVFHGTPTATQQAAFTSEVLQVVQSTYNHSGLNISLTTDPTQNYAHTLSVVSGASYSGNGAAIGITDVGNDGFSFIDKFGQAKSPDELAKAIGNNIAHELMHAFGIAGHPDQTGTYIDAATANWSTLTGGQTTFSPQAAQLLAAQNFLNGPGKDFTQGALGLTGLELLTEHHPVLCNCPYCQGLRKLKAAAGLSIGAASPVPEPTTVALWGFAATAALMVRRRTRRSTTNSVVR